MRLRFLAVPIFVVAGLALTGCFSFQGFSWSSPSVDPGKSDTASVTVVPFTNTSQKDFPFTLVGTPTNGDFSVGNKNTWDAKGHFNGPQAMLKDSTLANLVISNDYCSGGGIDPGAFTSTTWTAVRTQSEVRDKGKTSKTSLEKIQIKASNSPSVTGQQERIEFLTGVWNDDGDGQPEPASSSDDSYGCTGGTVTNLSING